MSDKYLMDGHKLIWHLDRVSDWLKGKRITPVHIDVGLIKGCNIRCEYCFGVLQGNFYKKGAQVYFSREPLLRYMRDAGKMGVRSMGFIGEGEPLLNPNVYDAIVEAKRSGVDVSLGTNGILLDTGRNGLRALAHLSWIRFNISAGSIDAYKRVHRSEDFPVAVEKIKFCVQAKKKHRLHLTIGLQMVLTPSNADQVLPLAKLGRKLGADYLVIKQCSDTVENELGVFDKLGEYKDFLGLLGEAEALSSRDYSVIVKWIKITNKGARNYSQCLGAPFLLYSSGDGKLYPCGMCFDSKKSMEAEFRLGDLVRQSFAQIIRSKRYQQVIEKVMRLDVNKCYSNCRTHAINEFAWSLKHPPEHVNFI